MLNNDQIREEVEVKRGEKKFMKYKKDGDR